jgi:hypothetical protein
MRRSKIITGLKEAIRYMRGVAGEKCNSSEISKPKQ